jgi:carbohydrate kinase (thermoresistant glucokinase family)
VNGVKTSQPGVVIFMGVAGSGKTTMGRLFAQQTGAVFHEGDDFHPPENITKMREGIPLTDADRAPWLLALRKIIADSLAKNIFTALTCSALKAKYREQLQAGDRRVWFVYLTAPPGRARSALKKPERTLHAPCPAGQPTEQPRTANRCADHQL